MCWLLKKVCNVTGTINYIIKQITLVLVFLIVICCLPNTIPLILTHSVLFSFNDQDEEMIDAFLLMGFKSLPGNLAA